jgi:putative ABC transport system permease protein
VELIGFDPKQDFTITPWLVSNVGHEMNKDDVVVGSRIQGEIGSALMFYGHNYTIAGRLEPTGMGIDTSVFVRMEDAYHMASESEWKADEKLDLSPDTISSVLVRVKEGEDPEVVGARIQSVIPETRVITPNYLVNRVADQMSGARGFLDGISLVIIIFSFPFVALISYMIANERKREISMIITMGGSKSFIFGLILAETMILAIIGAAIGVTVSSLIFYSFHEFIAFTLQIPYIWPSIPGVFIFGGVITGVAIIVGIVASLYPAFQASSIEPSEELWRGEF